MGLQAGTHCNPKDTGVPIFVLTHQNVSDFAGFVPDIIKILLHCPGWDLLTFLMNMP